MDEGKKKKNEGKLPKRSGRKEESVNSEGGQEKKEGKLKAIKKRRRKRKEESDNNRHTNRNGGKLQEIKGEEKIGRVR